MAVTPSFIVYRSGAHHAPYPATPRYDRPPISLPRGQCPARSLVGPETALSARLRVRAEPHQWVGAADGGTAGRGARRWPPSRIDAPCGPAVHRDADAGEERRARRGEEADEVGDVLGRGDTPELVGRQRLRADLLHGPAAARRV